MTQSALHKSLFYVCIYIIHVIYTLLSFSSPFLCTRSPLTSLNLFIFNNYMFCTSYTIFVWFERKQSSSSAETQKHQQKKTPKKPRKMYDINRMKYQRVCRGFHLEIRLEKCSSNYQKKRTLSMKLDPCERDTY